MNRFFSLLQGALNGPPLVIGPKPLVIGPRPSSVVEAPPRFAWDEKRWTFVEGDGERQLQGRFKVHDRRNRQWREFAGRLVDRNGGIAAYIADPPLELKRHRHGACLQLVQAPWFRLHWSRQPRTLDDALLYMERMLDEAFNNGGR